MANHKQALKRHKQSLKRHARNRFFISTMRTHIKRARQALQGDSKETAFELVKGATAYIQKVAGKGMIHKNKAARLVSRMSSRFHKTFEK